MKAINLGGTLSSLREKHALTQKEHAKLLGVHVTTIKNWESDNCAPDVKNICALADLFHVTTYGLLGREENETFQIPELTDRERKQLFQIIQAYIDTRSV